MQEKEVKLRGIKWAPKKIKVFWNENMRICWEFMRVNKITLGGVNFICTYTPTPDDAPSLTC